MIAMSRLHCQTDDIVHAHCPICVQLTDKCMCGAPVGDPPNFVPDDTPVTCIVCADMEGFDCPDCGH